MTIFGANEVCQFSENHEQDHPHKLAKILEASTESGARQNDPLCRPYRELKRARARAVIAPITAQIESNQSLVDSAKPPIPTPKGVLSITQRYSKDVRIERTKQILEHGHSAVDLIRFRRVRIAYADGVVHHPTAGNA